MGALRERFWQLPLSQLDRAEWEALCDGCGQCCTHKLEDEDTGAIAHTNVACRLLDTGTARCRDYRNRKIYVPDCMRLTPKLVAEVAWLPVTCAYKVRERGEPLPEWHYLVSGRVESVVEAGISVAGRVISEVAAGPIEQHITGWVHPE